MQIETWAIIDLCHSLGNLEKKIFSESNLSLILGPQEEMFFWVEFLSLYGEIRVWIDVAPTANDSIMAADSPFYVDIVFKGDSVKHMDFSDELFDKRILAEHIMTAFNTDDSYVRNP